MCERRFFGIARPSAADVVVMATHLVMAGNAREKFRKSPVVRVIGSDSFPGRENDEDFQIYSLAPLLASVLKKDLKIG